jgi:hypothetical protein
MSISIIGSQTSLIVQSLVDMRAQLDDLQRQLGTGKKSDTYAGLGLERGMAVGLRARLSALGGYDEAITNVGVRINLAQSALGRLTDVGLIAQIESPDDVAVAGGRPRFFRITAAGRRACARRGR